MGFHYIPPKSIEETVSMLSRFYGKAKVIAGGTDLLIQIKNKMTNPEYVIDITGIPELERVSYDENEGLRIGTLTSIRTLETSTEIHQRYPVISQAASQLGSVAIRNVATVGGNLCNALPSAEMAQALLALSARAKITGPSGERVVPLEDFFTGVGTTVLKPEELLVEIQVPPPLANTRARYHKHSTRGSIDLAIVNVAVVVTLEPEGKVCKDIRIALGAVAPTPMRARKAEEAMKGEQINEALINRTAQLASDEAHPRPGSIRGSVEYKKEMVKVFTRRLIKEAVAERD
jgi:CO/xanthine dehydrogenase FAD-binding subunit